MDAPRNKEVTAELDETDLSEAAELPDAIVLDELVVEVVLQGDDPPVHCPMVAPELR